MRSTHSRVFGFSRLPAAECHISWHPLKQPYAALLKELCLCADFGLYQLAQGVSYQKSVLLHYSSSIYGKEKPR